jgi:hypothetical protein
MRQSTDTKLGSISHAFTNASNRLACAGQLVHRLLVANNGCASLARVGCTPGRFGVERRLAYASCDRWHRSREAGGQGTERIPARHASRHRLLLPIGGHTRHPLCRADALHPRAGRRDRSPHGLGDGRHGTRSKSLRRRGSVRRILNGLPRCGLGRRASQGRTGTVASWRAAMPSSAAPETNSSRIDRMDSLGSPVSFATIPVRSGPSTAANLPIML